MILNASLWLMLFIIGVTLSVGVRGETYRTQSWSVDNIASATDEWDINQGLPQISVRALSFDKDGMLWVGTEHGLARFDGKQFEIFNTNNTAQLKSNWIDSIYTSRDGRVWIATADGVLVRNEHLFEVIDGFGSDTRVSAITQTSDGSVWLGGAALWKVDNGQIVKTIELEFPIKYLSNYNGRVIFTDLRNQFFTLRDESLVLGNSLTLDGNVDTPSSFQSLHFSVGANFYEVNADTVALYELDSTGVALMNNQSRLNEDIVALSANEQHLYAVTAKGSIFRNTLALSQAWAPLMLPVNAPVDANVTTFKVNGDSLWFGNFSSGLRVFWPSSVSREGEHPISSGTIASAKIWSFYADSSLYATSDDGVFVRDSHGQWRRIITPAQIEQRVAYSYLRDNSYEWVGTRAGLYVKAYDARSFTTVAELGQRQINSLVKQGTSLWVATNRGLFTITSPTLNEISDESSAESGSEAASYAIKEVTEFKNTPIRSIFNDSAGRTWIGTETALFLIDNSVVTQVELPVEGSVFVSSIAQLPDGKVIVSSYGEGLFVQTQEQQWRQLSERHGLPFQSLFGMALDTDWIWLSSASGVFRIAIEQMEQLSQPDFDEVSVQTILRDDGRFTGRNRLRCCNGAGNRRAILFEGSLFLPTLEGVLSVSANPRMTPIEQVVVRSVQVDQRRLQWQDIISLPSDKRDIDIAFTAPLFNSEDIIQYRYRMLPSQPDWTYTTQRQVAYFTNLPPGQSQFEVQARVAGDEWVTSKPLIIEAQYKPLETNAVRLLGLLALFALIWGIVQIRTRQLKSRALQLESLVAARTADYERVNRELVKTNQELRHAAVTDALTGLYNRRFVQQNLAKLMALINRQHTMASATKCVVVVIDIDRFKDINDHFGHDKGDEVLVATSRALQNTARDSDYLVRWGGEEFVLIVPSITTDDIAKIRQRIHSCVVEVSQTVGLATPLTLSIGMVCLPWSDNPVTNKTWERALTLADHALYQAKANGRHCSAITHVEPAMEGWTDWSARGLDSALEQKLWSIKLEKPSLQ